MSWVWPGPAFSTLVWVEGAFLAYFLLVNSFYAVLLIAAVGQMRGYRRRSFAEQRWLVKGSDIAPRVSMLAPAFNEEASIVHSVQGLLTLDYPSLQVVVINDGSTDATVSVLRERFEMAPVNHIWCQDIPSQPVLGIYRSRLYPSLLLVDKKNGRKADALNAGVNVADGELVCALDADTLVESEALQQLARPFVAGGDGVVAAGGTIRVINHCTVRDGRVTQARVPTHPLAGFQMVEYTRAFLFGRLGWNSLGGNLIISGAFGLFRRAAIVRAGGYYHDTVGEDMDLVCLLRQQAMETGQEGRVEFVPEPVAWTQVPESLATLGRQRDRWHRGLADVLWRRRRILFNPSYKGMGLVGFPYFTFVELMAPVMEALGLAITIIGVATGALDVEFAILFFLVAYGYGLILTMGAVALEEFGFRRFSGLTDRLKILAWVLLENLGYRQLTVFWRLRGIYGYLRGSRDWGAMQRRGFSSNTDGDGS